MTTTWRRRTGRRRTTSRPPGARGRLVLALLAAALASSGLAFASPPAAAAPTRYLDPVFTDVTQTSNITYGAAVNDRGQLQQLQLDLFEPTGDTEVARPAIVWIHGGGFVGGTRSTMFDLARDFARLGYVTVSITYRLASSPIGGIDESDPRTARAHRDAQHDAQAAVRFLRANAATYRIDPRHIAAGGGSAGAATAVRMGYANEDVGTSGHPDQSSRICAAMPLSGAVHADLVDPSDGTATIWFGGTADTIVPEVATTASHGAVRAAGLPSELHMYPGARHVDMGAFRPGIFSAGTQFFYDHVAGTARDCRVEPATPAGGHGAYHPAGPRRILDTRTPASGGPLPFGPGEQRSLAVGTWPSMPPTGVKAVLVNLTAVNPTQATHLTAWATGPSPPTASVLNAPAGADVAGLATVPVAPDGTIRLANHAGQVHVVADLVGWYGSPAGTTYHPVAPTRALDTRAGGVALGPGESRLVPLVGVGGLPATGVAAVSLNVTAVAPSQATHLTVWNALGDEPLASNLNVAAGQTVANQVVSQAYPTNAVAVRNHSGTTHLVVDLVGWFATPAGTAYQATGPVRAADTRDGTGGVPAQRLAPGGQVTLDLASSVGLPAGTSAVDVTVTAVQSSAASHLTAWAAGSPMPPTSTVNTAPGRTVANHATLPVSPDGRLTIANHAGTTDLVVDVDGWFGSAG